MKFLFYSLILLLTHQAHASLRVGTYNIRNFDYDVRSNTPTNKLFLVETIKSMNVDLLAVEEVHNTEEFNHMVETQFNGRYKVILSNCGGAHGQRLGFIYDISKLNLNDFSEDMGTVSPGQEQRNPCVSGSRPIALGTFTRKDTNESFVALAVHLKSGGQQRSISKRFRQLEVISQVVKRLNFNGEKNIIIMGDFNSTEYILKNNTYRKFVQSVNRMNLTETTTNLSCSAYWWGGSNDSRQYPSTLDHILVSQNFSNKATSSEVFGHCRKLHCQSTPENQMGRSFDEVSDHCPILTELE